MNNYCVYCHTTPSNRKYVGISCNPHKRWNSGKGYIKNYLFYRAIQKYGWESIKHEILYDNLNIEEAKDIEERLISEWSLIDPKFGYNLVSKKDGRSDLTRLRASISQKGNKNSVGRTLSTETRSKISSTLKCYFSNPKNRNILHRHHTESTKEKLRNRQFSDETKAKMKANHYDCSGAKNPSAKPVIQIALSGEVIQEFPFASLAAKKYGLDLSSLIKCCRGKHKTCGGYIWRYK